MNVRNDTKSVITYAGKMYGPGRTIPLKDGDEKKRDIAAMIDSSQLSVSLGGDDAPPSHGLNVEQLKALLTENHVPFEPNAKKAELAALVDANVKP